MMNEFKSISDLVGAEPIKKLDHRPFFSIVIPCYNSKNTIGNLLQSIVDQDMSDDIEVILSDDHSTEDYTDAVEPFLEQICIKVTQTEYNYAPGNTREAGVQLATGQWLCFADHDDEFIPKSLINIKSAIETYGEQYYAVANFLEVDTQGNVLQELKRTRNWNHAKFYNVDNLWKPFDIHFKKDLLTHEDIYISSRVNCAMSMINGDNPLYIDCLCYKWVNRPTTISRERYGNHSFLEVFFKDYLESTGYAYIDQYLAGQAPVRYATDAAIGVLILSYFYSESFVFYQPKTYMPENFDELTNYLIKCKETFGINNEYIYQYVASNGAEFYEKQRVAAMNAVGSVMPTRTFMQWLDYLHHDIQPKYSMSDSMWKQN